jgi:hypothetical protein
MTVLKSLPAQPSLESLRKQAKKLARDIAAGDAAAIARARAHLQNAGPPLTQRNTRLVIAPEYGFAGWRDLTAEVGKRLGRGLVSAVTQARRVIHDNDVERLKQLLADYPTLLSWQADKNGRGVLGMATSAYALDVGRNAERERDFTRAACAEPLIEAGAVVAPSVCEDILESRAHGLLELCQRKGLLPRTLEFFAALGNIDAVRTALDENGDDAAAVNEAFVRASLFAHEDVASLRLERAIALDPELGEKVDRGVDAELSSSVSSKRGQNTSGNSPRTRERSDCGRPSSSSRSAAPARMATWRRSSRAYSASRGCSVTPRWTFKMS